MVLMRTNNMMKCFSWLILLILLLLVPSGNGLLAQASLRAGALKLTLDRLGRITSLTDLAAGRELLDRSVPAPLLTIRHGKQEETPGKATYDRKKGLIVLDFPVTGVRVTLSVALRETYMTLTVKEIHPAGVVDVLVWGPVPLVIGATVGEIIGIVRDDRTAFGLQVLNPETLGGLPLSDEGSDPSRGNTARRTATGSSVQAYTLDRSRPRNINVWWDQFPAMPVAPIPGETAEGSSVALFACAPDRALELVGEIETAEGLPHPLIDGIWAKRSPETGRSYLIADFTESTVDELLEYTRRAGLMTLYHMYPWQSWGHYAVDTVAFPHGEAGLKACAEKANKMGIRLGAHTLTDFINTNDPYVTPVPDPRLAKTGSGVLEQPVNEADSVIFIREPAVFANRKANWLRTVMIGSELVTYDSVTEQVPFRLLGCRRGAFGTRAASHKAGEEAAKLLDHPYKVFFPGYDMMQEIAQNLAEQFNRTGLGQMDFDGFEGCLSTGQGDYAMEQFARTFYDHLDHTVLNGTSMSEPFYWHINTYCNWGEPWYGGFRESMQEYRISNQSLFGRNYLPNMLGWYLLTDSTTLADMEWMLARAAGYNAGFAMATSLKALRMNPNTLVLLDAIREWEACRRGHAFPDSLTAALRDPAKEFHLEKTGPGTYDLYPVIRVTNPDLDQPPVRRGEPVRIVVRGK